MIQGEVLPGEDPATVADSADVKRELGDLGVATSLCLRDPLTRGPAVLLYFIRTGSAATPGLPGGGTDWEIEADRTWDAATVATFAAKVIKGAT